VETWRAPRAVGGARLRRESRSDGPSRLSQLPVATRDSYDRRTPIGICPADPRIGRKSMRILILPGFREGSRLPNPAFSRPRCWHLLRHRP
jgi:hypothetical protein